MDSQSCISGWDAFYGSNKKSRRDPKQGPEYECVNGSENQKTATHPDTDEYDRSERGDQHDLKEEEDDGKRKRHRHEQRPLS